MFQILRLPGVAAVQLIVLAAAALLPGCAMLPELPFLIDHPPTQSSPSREVPRAQPTGNSHSDEWLQGSAFADLPIPPNFELMSDESYVFLQGSIRSADLNYIGNAIVSDVIRFYQKEMPPLGWYFVRFTGINMKTLSYSNGVEICEIILERHSEHSSAPDASGTEEWHDGVSAGPDDTPKLQTHLHIKLHER